MYLKDVIIDVERTFGKVKFKKIVLKIFKYDSNNKRTEEFIGFKILVESVAKRDVFEVKIYDDSTENYRYIATNETDMYDAEIGFDNLTYNAYVFKGKMYETIAADSFSVVDAFD